MEVRVHATHFHPSEDLKAFAESKVAHAARMFDDTRFADVEFSAESNPRIAERFRVEITATAAGQTVRVESSALDERAALDIAVDKFERQLRRLKERLIGRSRQHSDKRLNAATTGVEEDSPAMRRLADLQDRVQNGERRLTGCGVRIDHCDGRVRV